MKEIILTPGVKPLPYDMRDRQFDLPKVAKFGAPIPKPSDLPVAGEEGAIGRDPISIENQLASNFCTAGTSNASEFQEGVPLSFLFQVAAISRRSGEPILNGADPRQALQAACAYGSLEEKDSPFTVESALQQFGEGEYEFTSSGNKVIKSGWMDYVANWKNWPDEVWGKAKEHVKRAYPWVKGEYDVFDNIRTALWRGKEKNQVVMAFGKWFTNWQSQADGMMPIGQGRYSLHYFYFYDFGIVNGKEVVFCANSYGKKWGKDGICYFDRETINKAWDGVFYDGTALAIFEDADPNSVEALKQQKLTLIEIIAEILNRIIWGMRGFGSTTGMNLVLDELRKVLLSLLDILPSLFPRPAYDTDPKDLPMNQDDPKPVEPPKPKPVPAPEKATQMVLRVCKEEGLTVKTTNEVYATIHCESNFDNSVQNWNCENGATRPEKYKPKVHGKVLSKDYGICQINDYWHIGKGKTFPSVEYVQNNPEAVVRWMCRMAKAGKLNLWVCYSKGLYKKYL